MFVFSRRLWLCSFVTLCVGVPTANLSDLLGRTHRIQHTVALLAMIYYSERTQSKTTKENHAWGEVWGRPGGASKSPSSSPPPARCHTGCAYSSSDVKGCHVRRLTRDSVPRVFIRGRLLRHLLPGTYQSSDSQRESRCSV